MARRYIVQAVFERRGAASEDNITNTWHFEGDDGAENWAQGVDGLVDRLHTFYGDVGTNYFSSSLTGLVTYKVYDAADPTPGRIPRDVQVIPALPRNGGIPLPAEVAVCLSYQAAKVQGGKQARRRGRIFLGPLSASILDEVGPTTRADARPEGEALTIILAAAKIMATGNPGAPRLAVYSPTQAKQPGATVDSAWNDAVELWVDDAFDTVRSRGAKARYKTFEPIAP